MNWLLLAEEVCIVSCWSWTPGSFMICSSVYCASYQFFCLISTSDFINMNTGFSLMVKSWAKAYLRYWSAALCLPASLLMSAARTWASTTVPSFYRQSLISLSAPGVSLKSQRALASSTWAWVKPAFYFVTFSRSLMALTRCFGGPAEVIFGFAPQWTRYSWASSMRKSALSLI